MSFGGWGSRLRAAGFALAVVLGATGVLAPAFAQTPPATPAPAPATGQATANAAQRAKLDGLRIQLDQLEAGLQRRAESDDALQALRAQIDPLAEVARAVIAEQSPRADAIRQRLKELGAKPDDKSPPESADISREREDRQAALSDIDDSIRVARALLVQAEQIEKEIADKRRSLFAKRLFESSFSLASPTLWADIAANAPHDVSALVFVGQSIVDRAGTRLTPSGAAAAAGALILAVILIVPVRRFALSFVKRDRLAGQPSRLQIATAAATITVVGAAGPFLAAYLLYQIVQAVDLLPPRMLPVFASLVGAAAFVGLVRSLADGLVAPDRRNWRLFEVSDERAERLMRRATVLAILIGGSRFVEQLYQSIAAGLKLSVATKGMFAVAILLVLARALQEIRLVDPDDEAAFGPHVGQAPDYSGPIRVIGWVMVALIGTSVLLGYIAFAWFMAEQMAWAGIVLTTTVLLLILVDEGITQAFSAQGKTAGFFRGTVGLSRTSLEQIGILTSGFVRLLLIGLAVILLLAPWGVESGDILSSFKALFFGFSVGGVTLSLSTVLLAVIVFAVGIVTTRAVQRWLQNRYFPHTHLDAGLKNSISMGIGYLGLTLTAAIAVSYLGLSLDKLTIVAGALSVGIGFGLQSIVANFVSGLILLAERGIRVGDWIVVGGEQGYVRRINVRATQIETFDRATLIVPNSNLVTGVVKNWVHSDRTGRVLISVPAPRDADPDAVSQLLRSVAEAHSDVMDEPGPRVLFKSITESAINFDLICFVAEIDTAARVSSDLTFAIFRKMREMAIIKPAAPPTFELAGLAELRLEMAEVRKLVVDGAGEAQDEKDAAVKPPVAPEPPKERRDDA